jgi:phosphoribosylglycinamide formyltransferase-1
MPLSLAILISGRGSNMQAIHRAVQAGQLEAQIRVVLSDQPGTAGVKYAEENQLPLKVIPKEPQDTRLSHQEKMIGAIQGAQAHWVALAGFMRLLSPEFIRAFPDRILNIHPSLLPAFPGLHPQRQALEAGVKYSGCTVHFVDEGCDTGPILDQSVVPVLPDDDEEKLAARILVEEHRLYPQCLQKISEGKVLLEGKRVQWLP